jgi:FixJ family two-component response regulator
MTRREPSPPAVARTEEAIVFVVDDDQGVREATRSLLASVGLRAETFKTAQEFLSSRRPDGPGCLVLDVRLPGLSGLDLQRELARTGEPIPIVFITGHADVPMSVQAMKAGAVEFLTKPFRDQQLLDAIQQAVDRDRRESRHRAELGELRRRYESLTPREREVMARVAG